MLEMGLDTENARSGMDSWKHFYISIPGLVALSLLFQFNLSDLIQAVYVERAALKLQGVS